MCAHYVCIVFETETEFLLNLKGGFDGSNLLPLTLMMIDYAMYALKIHHITIN